MLFHVLGSGVGVHDGPVQALGASKRTTPPVALPVKPNAWTPVDHLVEPIWQEPAVALPGPAAMAPLPLGGERR